MDYPRTHKQVAEMYHQFMESQDFIDVLILRNAALEIALGGENAMEQAGPEAGEGPGETGTQVEHQDVAANRRDKE